MADNFLDEILEGAPQVVTRFPPEPHGYLHIGHAKAICANFGLAEKYGGVCHLRMDDTNPLTESAHYVEAIERDVRWLGFDWYADTSYASDEFEWMFRFAVRLIREGRAYVCDLSEEEFRTHRGTITTPGTDSPYRDRSIEENLELFLAMRAGDFPDGAKVLRARIDMAHPNMKMRDPPLYRIRHATHHRTGDAWCIYPMYDYAHPLEDFIESVTHSFCTLEFENNRAIYDWVLSGLRAAPRQYEFARLSLEYTVLSKRKLRRLVEEGHVSGWDDPRMPTIAGLRRRGVPASAIRTFCERIGIAKANSTVDMALFEHTLREDLNESAPRVMGVVDPLKVVIENYPEGEVDWLECSHWPRGVDRDDTRKVPFTRELYIERADFMEDPPRKYKRLTVGREVRLRSGYYITCTDVIKRDDEIVELRCTYDPESRGGSTPDGRKVRGTIHWVSAVHGVPAEIRMYDRLFTEANL